MKELLAYIRYFEGLTVSIVCVLVTTQLGALSFLSLPVIYRIVYERLIPTYDKRLLIVIVFSFFFVQALFAIFNFISVTMLAHIRGRMIVAMRNRISMELLFHPYPFFTKYDVGAVIQRLIPEVDTVASTLSGAIQGIAYVMQLGILFAAAFFFDPFFFLICTATSCFYIVWQKIFKRPIVYFSEKTQARQQELYEKLTEHLGAIKPIKLFNIYEQSLNQLSMVLKSLGRNILFNSLCLSLVRISSKALDIAILAILLYAMYRISTGQMVIGTYIVFSSFIWCFVSPVNFLIDLGNNLQAGKISARRIGELLTEQCEPSGTLKFMGVTKGITFKNVEFGYVRERRVLAGMSFEITAGSTVAFVGLSGSGKSTIVQLLMRLYTMSKGTIVIDENPIQSYDLASLRDGIGVLAQDTFLFNDTLIANVDPHRKHTRGNIQEFLEKTDLKEFGERLDYGVGENGWNLSAGERQRLALARLFAQQPKVVILDEATANLDPRTELVVLNNVQSMKRDNPNLTIIMITHSKNYLSQVDCVYFVENGAVTDRGKHADLMLGNTRYVQALHILNKPASV